MRSLRTFLIIATAAMALSSTGCIFTGEGSHEIAITPLDRPIRYLEEFDVICAAPASDGGYDLVLSNGIRQESITSGKRLYPLPQNQTLQVIIIHVSWRPARGTKSDSPATTNSTINWYIFTDLSSATPGYIKYSGIGLVAVELDEDTSLFSLLDITVRPEEIVGKSKDYLGPSRLTGTLRATNDEQRTRAIMAQLHDLVSAPHEPQEQTPATQPQGMPPARRQGP